MKKHICGPLMMVRLRILLSALTVVCLISRFAWANHIPFKLGDVFVSVSNGKWEKNVFINIASSFYLFCASHEAMCQ